jgi:hypothetical protein
MNGTFANYLWTMFWGSVFWIFWIMWFFPRKYKYRCIRVYVWFKDDKHVIWMRIWLILTNISLLDRIWSLWLVRFAHSPPSFIFWLGMLIFSVSINSHPDNIYIYLRIGQEYSANVAWSTFQSLKLIQPLLVCAGFFICIRNSLDRPCVTMSSWSSPLKCKVSL